MSLPVLALSMALLVTAGASATAQTMPAAPVAATLTDPELDGLRGGFLTAGELKFEFGAMVRTYADGALALRTNVTWSADGAKIDQQPGAGVLAGAPLEGGRAAIGGVDGAFRTPDGAAIIHQATEGRLANFLVNTGSNRSFRQETDVTLTLPGFAAVQGALSQQLLGARLNADIAAGALRASR